MALDIYTYRSVEDCTRVVMKSRTGLWRGREPSMANKMAGEQSCRPINQEIDPEHDDEPR